MGTKTIDQILQEAGIAETQGQHDRFKEDIVAEGKAKRNQSDKRFLPGRISANLEEDERILRELDEAAKFRQEKASNQRNDALAESIWKHETTAKRGEFNVYEATLADGKTEINIGPGLRLNDPSNRKLFADEGLDVDNIMIARQVSPEDYPKVEKVYRKRIKRAEQDAVKFTGGSEAWKTLSQNERDALTNMSYNLGAKGLGKFKNMNAALRLLTKARTSKEGFDEEAEENLMAMVASEMEDSQWFRQVGRRAQDVILKFLGEKTDYMKRYKKFLG